MPVVDASFVLAIALSEDGAAAAADQLRRWRASRADLHSPMLMPYEFINILARASWDGRLAKDDLSPNVRGLSRLGVHYHPPHQDLERALEIAGKLQRRSAYDATYLALAERLDEELWTLDGRLGRNAKSAGFPIRLIEHDSRPA